MVISMDYHPDNPPYYVTANVWCEEYNDYIAHWDAGVYDDYDKAFERWGEWMPPMDDVEQACRDTDEELGFRSRYELEVGMWDSEGFDHAFMNQAIEH